MKFINLFKPLVILKIAVISLFFSTNLLAEDIEIYVSSLLNEKEKARVMLMFDTSGSMEWSSVDGGACYVLDDDDDWEQIECVEKTNSDGSPFRCYSTGVGSWVNCPASRMQVAKKAVNELIDSTEDVEFGLARFGSGKSGYLVYGIGTVTDKTTLKAKVNSLPASGATPLMDSSFEIYRYFSDGNLFEAQNFNGRDKTVDNGSSYTSPFRRAADGKLRCDNNAYVIFMTDGDPNGGTSSKSRIQSLTGKTYSSTESLLPELAKYMANNDLYSTTSEKNHVYTYTIGFGNGMKDSSITMLKNMASESYGKGKYEDATDASKLADSLAATINDILDRVGNFTSPSVAASQSDNTRTKDYVYYSLFSPSGFSKWNGNIKKLKIDGHSVTDQVGANAIDDNGGIKQEAKTYWTDFTNKVDGALPGADGSNVTVGGLDDNLSAPDSRKIYTDVNGFPELKTSASEVVTAMQTALGSGSTVEQAKAMIDWMRGISGYDADGKAIVREHILGDALHSKPAAITYEGTGGDKTYLIYGTNAGFVHFFEDTSDTSATEMWSFVPSELFSIQSDLKENGLGKVYGMDLTPTIYHDDSNGDGKVNSGEDVWAFVGMRRGGRSYYALDISDKNSPSLLWTIKGGEGDFANLGQTWSEPRVIYIDHQSYSGKPLLVFGAGFDKAHFEDGSSNSMGAGVYIVDAETKALVWSSDDVSFAGQDSITGSIAILDSDYDGLTDRLYAADTGGNVWRFDLAGSNPSDWSSYKLAQLSGNFFYQPEVARSYYSKVTSYAVDNEVVNVSRMMVPFEAVVIGSGNRTNPLNTSTSDNLFMVRDTNVITKSYKTGAPSAINVNELMTITPDTFGSLTSDYADFVEQESIYASYKGWKYVLTGSGEKALAKPAIIGGVAYFPTFIAGSTGSSSCSLTGGEGRLYAFHLHYAVNIYENAYTKTGDSIPPTPELIFSEDSDKKSQFLLIGIGAGEEGSGIIKAKSIVDSATPSVDKDGNVQLVSGFAGFQTHRSYMYREATNGVN